MSQNPPPNWILQLCEDVQNGQFPANLTEDRFNDVLKWLLEREFITGKMITDTMRVSYDSEASARQNTFLALDDRLFILSEDSPFELLGLKGNADMAVVKARYRRLIQLYHPDRGLAEANGLTERAERINQSYDRIKSGDYKSEYEARPAYQSTPRSSMADTHAADNTLYRARASDSIRLALGSSKKLTFVLMSALFFGAVLLVYIVYSNNRPIDYHEYNTPEQTPSLPQAATGEAEPAASPDIAASEAVVLAHETQVTPDSSTPGAGSPPEIPGNAPETPVESSTPAHANGVNSASVAEEEAPPTQSTGNVTIAKDSTMAELDSFSEMLAQAEMDIAINSGSTNSPSIRTETAAAPIKTRQGQSTTRPTAAISSDLAPQPFSSIPSAPAQKKAVLIEQPPISIGEPTTLKATGNTNLSQRKIVNTPIAAAEPKAPSPPAPRIKKPVVPDSPVLPPEKRIAKPAAVAPPVAATIPVASVATTVDSNTDDNDRFEPLTPSDRKLAIDALKGYVNGMLAGSASLSLKYVGNTVMIDEQPQSKAQLRQIYQDRLINTSTRVYQFKIKDVFINKGLVRITGRANMQLNAVNEGGTSYKGPMTFDIQRTGFGGQIVAISHE